MNKNNLKESVWAAAFAAEAEKRFNATSDVSMCVHRADWAVRLLETAFRNDLATPLAEEPLEADPRDEEILRLKELLRSALDYVDLEFSRIAGVKHPLAVKIEEALK